jgi:hypothetical protein
MSEHKFVLMDHGSRGCQPQESVEIEFDDFVKKLRAWLRPNRWINIQLSDGGPQPFESWSLIVKREEKTCT